MVPLRGLPEVLRGHTEARIFTPPLVDISKPENSYGHAVIRFAKYVLKTPLTPWQEWLVIRAGELLPDGRPRFRQVLVLIARQNGKTFLMEVLAMYWLLIEMQKMILGMSVNLQLAKETLISAVERAEDVKALARNLGTPKTGNNDVSVSTKGLMLDGKRRICHYKTTAATRKGPRGKRVDRLMVDELREQEDMEAYKAGMFTMQARPHGQAWFFTNQGDDRGVVLNMLHEAAMAYIKDPTSEEADERLGLFEWSAPPGMDVMDKLGWCMANPNLGLYNDESSIVSEAKKAKRLGGEVEAGFRTEVLCQRVKSMHSAVSADAWDACTDVGKFDEAASRAAWALDISADNLHATLTAAATLPDGRTRVGILKEWRGKGLTMKIRQELPGLARTHKPRKVGWFPYGPCANLSAWLKPQDGVPAPLGSVEVVEMRDVVADACMAFADKVDQEGIAHNGEDLLTTHVLNTSKKQQGERWVFDRRNATDHIDAAYAAAGAVYLAETLPPPASFKLHVVSD